MRVSLLFGVLGFCFSYTADPFLLLAQGEWMETQKLTASDAAEGDGFGVSVSVSEDVVVVGAWHDDDAGDCSG